MRNFTTFGAAAVTASLLFALSSDANALPITLSYTGTVSGSGGLLAPGVSIGDSIFFDITADNGGATLASQSWVLTDILGATFSAGTYSASTGGPLNLGSSFGGFSTDASGALSSLDLGFIQGGSDTGGESNFFIYMNDANDIWYAIDVSNVYSIAAIDAPDIANTTISPSAAPAPATLALFGLGLVGLSFSRRKKV